MRLASKLMTGAGVLALSTGFAAAAPAVVENDVNLRAGPGIEFPVVAAMPAGATVDVMTCEAGWCQVAFNRTIGWASRAYMGLGGGVAAGPAYRGYAEGYGFGGYAPRYGYGETYGYGGYSPGYTYGYYGNTGYRGSVGVSEGGRTFGNERRFGEETRVGGERRVGEATTIRGERRFNEQGAVRGERVNASANVRSNANVRGNEQKATAIKGNNPMRIRESTASANAPRNEERAPAIGGNNPMKAEKNAAPVSNAPAPTEIQGNNPMKVGGGAAAANQQRGTAQAGGARRNTRATTGAAPRENR